MNRRWRERQELRAQAQQAATADPGAEAECEGQAAEGTQAVEQETPEFTPKHKDLNPEDLAKEFSQQSKYLRLLMAPKGEAQRRLWGYCRIYGQQKQWSQFKRAGYPLRLLPPCLAKPSKRISAALIGLLQGGGGAGRGGVSAGARLRPSQQWGGRAVGVATMRLGRPGWMHPRPLLWASGAVVVTKYHKKKGTCVPDQSTGSSAGCERRRCKLARLVGMPRREGHRGQCTCSRGQESSSRRTWEAGGLRTCICVVGSGSQASHSGIVASAYRRWEDLGCRRSQDLHVSGGVRHSGPRGWLRR
jgi:hypothetical protein